MSEVTRVNPPQPPHDFNESVVIVLILKIVVVAVFMLPLAQYVVFPAQEFNTTSNDPLVENPILNESSEEIQKPVKKPIKIRILQPSCPKSYQLVILSEICLELYEKNELCTPEDVHNEEKHKIPKHARNNTNGEPRGTVVGYFAVLLLVGSLAAALVELYKGKSEGSSKTNKSKAPLSRKCSLADLTVLKHHRKELIRRESILELPEDGSSSQLGNRPPLFRRSSFPTAPSVSTNQKHEYKRIASLDSRRSSIIDRTNPYLADRRTSLAEDSPERRHHSRLFYRH